jgi:general secretion pathway protein G
MKTQEINSSSCRNKRTYGSLFNTLHKPGIMVSRNVGFTLIELLVIVAIIGILVIIATPIYSQFMNSAKSARCAADIRILDKEITGYQIDKGILPDNLNQIHRANFKDPWGNPYVYTNLTIVGSVPFVDFSGTDLNDDFDLYSKGSNGVSTGDLGDSDSLDDVVRYGNGGSVGLGKFF